MHLHMEDFHHVTVSGFDAVIGGEVNTQTRCDVSDAETQIYKMIDHVASDNLQIMTTKVHKPSLILFIMTIEAHRQISVLC